MAKKRKLLLISKRAFYPPHWLAFKKICEENNLDGEVITTRSTKIPLSHQQLGWFGPDQNFKPDVHYLPNGNLLKKTIWLFWKLDKINPDFIWVQEEPIDEVLLIVLMRYSLQKTKPKIVSAICENIFHKASFWFQPIRVLLWRRLNGLLPVAEHSLNAAYAVGIPTDIPAGALVAGFVSPPKNPLVFNNFATSRQEFIVGFVGRLVSEKGWETLINSLKFLPKFTKILIVGSGGDQNKIDKLISTKFKKRVFRFDVMDKSKLWGFYKKIDCLVLPSTDTNYWKEQSGGVLVDAMSLGIPVIGSNSGGIPDIIGNAGLIFDQKNAKLLASRIETLIKDPYLRKKLGQQGRDRFNKEFSVSAYSKKISRYLGISK